MGGDISRFTFDPNKRYSGVRQQQGRVNLDADWNEQVDIAAYRVVTETADIVGASGAPRDNSGFQIQQLSSLVWSPNTAFAAGTEIIDSNGNLQVAIGGGTSGPGPNAPTWATSAAAAPVVDGSTGLSWQFVGNADFTVSSGRIYVDGILCELKATPVPIQNFIGDGTSAAGTQVQVANVVVDGLALQAGQWVQISAQGSGAPAPLLVQVTEVDATSDSITLGVNISAFGSPNTNPQLQRAITYLTQADYPSPPQFTVPGVSIVYLDVWERTITGVEDPQILEVALGGPDTATRTKVVWQVKVVNNVASAVTCATAGSSQLWGPATQPSAGWLSNGLVPPTAPSACALSANTGYTGMENQFYRVEIHQGGAPGTATFKWSRDNGSVETAITAINPTTSSSGSAASQLTVQNTGRDQVLAFTPGNWVEVTDDYLELSGQAGQLFQIDINGVDTTRQTITLQGQVLAAFLSRFNSAPNYHPRIRRWDQGATIYESDNTTVWQSGGSNGITVPSDDTQIILENGITVLFGVNGAGGSFNVGDYWTFAARTATAAIDPLVLAKPFGILHHYCRLGVINFAANPWNVQDCRRVFPPLADSGVHVTGVYLPNTGNQLVNDSQINVQDLSNGINLLCDAALDSATVTQPNSTLPNSSPFGAQATCFVSVGVPSVNGSSIVGFNPMILPAQVSLDSTQKTIQWVPSNDSITALATQISTVASQISPTTTTTTPPSGATPVPLAPFLAHLTLKGNFIWAAGNPDVLLDGSTSGSPYTVSAGSTTIQQTGLQLPSGNGRPGSDFQMWFWLSSQPAASVSTQSLDFGNQLVGVASGAQTVTLTNNSTDALTVQLTSPTGDFAETDTCGGAAGGSLAAGQSCTINVTFTPSAQGTRSSTMSINAGIGGTFPIVLTGTGVAPALVASPSSLNFGALTMGSTSAPQNITLINNGSAPVTITGLTVIGSDSPDFSASYTPPPPIIPVRPIFPVIGTTLKPIGLAERALIAPISPTRPITPVVPVTPVTPIAPVAPIAPIAPVTPVVPVAPITPIVPVIPVTPVSPPTTLFTLQPGAQATISVQFSPKAFGLRTATLNIASDAPGSPLPIQLSGTGLFNLITGLTSVRI